MLKTDEERSFGYRNTSHASYNNLQNFTPHQKKPLQAKPSGSTCISAKEKPKPSKPHRKNDLNIPEVRPHPDQQQGLTAARSGNGSDLSKSKASKGKQESKANQRNKLIRMVQEYHFRQRGPTLGATERGGSVTSPVEA